MKAFTEKEARCEIIRVHKELNEFMQYAIDREFAYRDDDGKFAWRKEPIDLRDTEW